MIPCWSTANYTAEHNELQALSLAVSNSGKCILVSRKSLAIVNIDTLNDVELNIKRETKWDTTYAEFSTLQHDLVAVTNAQTVQVYDTSGCVHSICPIHLSQTLILYRCF